MITCHQGGSLAFDIDAQLLNPITTRSVARYFQILSAILQSEKHIQQLQ